MDVRDFKDGKFYIYDGTHELGSARDRPTAETFCRAAETAKQVTLLRAKLSEVCDLAPKQTGYFGSVEHPTVIEARKLLEQTGST